jgi:hypothetical protein
MHYDDKDKDQTEDNDQNVDSEDQTDDKDTTDRYIEDVIKNDDESKTDRTS